MSSPSLVGLWEAPDRAPAERPILSTGLLFFEERIALVENGRKYIWEAVSGREELYDLSVDPAELSPIDLSMAAVEQARGRLEEVLAEAAELRRQWGLKREERTEIDLDLRERLEALGYL